MNESGVVGLNIEKAQKDIRNLYGCILTASRELLGAYGGLFYYLGDTWASPNAVEFQKTYLPKIEDVIIKVNSYGNNIAYNAKKALEILARANGYWGEIKIGTEVEIDGTTQSGTEFDFYEFSNTVVKLSADKDGIVGMNVTMIKEIILPTFRKDTDSAVANLSEEVPLSLPFYDSEGNLVQTFTTNVGTYIDMVNKLTSEVVTAITAAIETEADTILLAKQEATDTMNA